jgi:hypothetical protein
VSGSISMRAMIIGILWHGFTRRLRNKWQFLESAKSGP